MELLDIIKERPIKEEVPTCPYCESTDLRSHGTVTTLVGFLGDVDPNHKWTETECRSCKKKFTREAKSGNVWYVDSEGVVLKGIPSCFETYIYHCAKCNGPVVRDYKSLEGEELKSFELEGRKVELLSTTFDESGKPVKQYRVFYNCTSCGHGGEVADDYIRSTPVVVEGDIDGMAR